MYGSQDEIGKSYVELNRAIQIVITNFNLLSKINYHSKFQLMDPEDGSIFSFHAEIHQKDQMQRELDEKMKGKLK